jgi:hypothetical protein
MDRVAGHVDAVTTNAGGIIARNLLLRWGP